MKDKINEYILALVDNNYIKLNDTVKYFDCYETRLFSDELIYAKNKYKITNAEFNLFMNIILYLQENTNILIYEGKALNQKELIKLLDADRKTIYKNITLLIEKNFIYDITRGKNKYYIVNPHLAFKGMFLNVNILGLFYANGYEPLKQVKLTSNINLGEYLNENTPQPINSNNPKVATDGTVCLSGEECRVHNFMLDSNIKITSKEKMYKDFINNQELKQLSGKMRCDWIIEIKGVEYIVEYFGLIKSTDYKIKHDLKQRIIELDNQKGNFISIYPKDLKNLEEVFISILNK